MILQTILALAFTVKFTNSQPIFYPQVETESTNYMQQAINAWKSDNTTKSSFSICNATSIADLDPLCACAATFMNNVITYCQSADSLADCINSQPQIYLGVTYEFIVF